jgi:hypothetical protein
VDEDKDDQGRGGHIKGMAEIRRLSLRPSTPESTFTMRRVVWQGVALDSLKYRYGCYHGGAMLDPSMSYRRAICRADSLRRLLTPLNTPRRTRMTLRRGAASKHKRNESQTDHGDT